MPDPANADHRNRPSRVRLLYKMPYGPGGIFSLRPRELLAVPGAELRHQAAVAEALAHAQVALRRENSLVAPVNWPDGVLAPPMTASAPMTAKAVAVMMPKISPG